MREVDRFDPVQANRELTLGSVAHLDRAPGFDPGGSRFDPCRGFHILKLRVHSSAGQSTGVRCRRREVRLLVGAPHEHGGIAQRLEQLSHKQHVVCSTHTPVTDRKEVVVHLANRGSRVRVVRRPRRPVIVFRFRGRLISLARRRASRSGGQHGHHTRRVAQSGQRERFGTARSEVRILPRRLSMPGRAIGSPPASEAGHVMVRIHPRQLHVRVAKRPKAHACKALNSSVRLRSRTPHAW
jgi:hypothetical protein